MTKLLIKQRVFSWSDTYDVYDKNGEPKYYVEADILSWGHKIHIYDHATDREVAYIAERVFTFLPKAEITVMGLPVGEIRKEFSFFSSCFFTSSCFLSFSLLVFSYDFFN